MTCRLPLLLVLGVAAMAQGTDPKPRATDYPVSRSIQDGILAAEFMVHTLSGQKQTIVVPEYLLVEIAIYPSAGHRLRVTAADFSLRVNGKREVPPQPGGMVAMSNQYRNWQRPHVEAAAGMGDTGVILGRPTPEGRFPGDPRPGQNRLPPPQVPSAKPDTGVEPEPKLSAQELITALQFQEVESGAIRSGYLFFPWKGKLKGIRQLELVYHAGKETVTVPLL